MYFVKNFFVIVMFGLFIFSQEFNDTSYYDAIIYKMKYSQDTVILTFFLVHSVINFICILGCVIYSGFFLTRI